MELLKKNQITNSKINILLFFIHPFAAFLLALSNLKSKSTFIIFMLFNILFGYTFIAEEKTADSYSYVQEFNATSKNTTNDYINDFQDYLTFNSNIKDIYVLTCNYLVSRFTQNYHILLALYAIVFSYYFLKSFHFLVDRKEFDKSYIAYSLAFLFIYSNSIYNINGVRFWTAAWLAVYIIFEVVINKNYKFILLSFLTPLIHISYLSFVGVLIIYFLSKKFDKIWVFFFIISFFIGNLSIELVQNYSYLFPKTGQDMAWAYADDYNIKTRMHFIEILPLYAKIFNKLPYLFINVIIFIFIINPKKIMLNVEAYSAYVFLLLWMSFVNFTISIPSFGGRFLYLAIPIIMYICLILYTQIKLLRFSIYLIPIIYSYSIFQWFRQINEIIDYYLLVSIFPHIFLKNL